MILIVSAVFPPETVVSANLSFDIASELAKTNEVVVLSPKPTRPFKKVFNTTIENSFPFKHQVLDSYTCPESKILGRFRESYSFGKASAKYIATNHKNIKLIYANTWPVFAQKLVVKVALKYFIPVIIHVQDIYPESLVKKIPPIIGRIVHTIFLPYDQYILQKATKVITISPQMNRYLINSRKLSDSKIYMVRNWQNDDFFQEYKLPVISENHHFTFMYLGSINPSAGVEMLIRAFGKANVSEARLIIAGNGSNKNSCITVAKEYQDAKIEFWEADQDKVPELQAKADILLLPLRKGIGKTASPSKLPAYMFSKKPIIASVDLDSDPSEIIQSANCGWVVSPGNIEKLAEQMKSVVTLPTEELNYKGENGFGYAQEKLSKKNNLQQLVSIILETF